MTEKEKELIASYWGRCCERLDVAELLFRSGYFDESANASFYSAFYSVSALLLTVGLDYKKHSAVKGAFQRDFIKAGALDRKFGRYYKFLESVRHVGDYGQLQHIGSVDATRALEQAHELTNAIFDYLDSKGIPYK